LLIIYWFRETVNLILLIFRLYSCLIGNWDFFKNAVMVILIFKLFRIWCSTKLHCGIKPYFMWIALLLLILSDIHFNFNLLFINRLENNLRRFHPIWFFLVLIGFSLRAIFTFFFGFILLLNPGLQSFMNTKYYNQFTFGDVFLFFFLILLITCRYNSCW